MSTVRSAFAKGYREPKSAGQAWRDASWPVRILAVLASLIVIAALVVVGGLITLFVWNVGVSPAFGASTINLLSAIALNVGGGVIVQWVRQARR